MNTQSPAVGLQSFAISVPDRIIDNTHWRTHHAQLVAEAEERIWMWKKPKDWTEGSEAFNREMDPYVMDPFRGARERRLMAPGGTSLSLEEAAARRALEAAELGPEDIDLLICTSFLPDSQGIGGATFLARALGLKGGAWNLESACSSTLIGFRTACSLVASGQHRRVLVVTSCTYSRVAPESDPVGWGIGDAASAMIVGPVTEGFGLLGSHTVHSGDTCGAITYELELDDENKPYHRLRVGKSAARLLRETSEPYLKACTGAALEQAGLELADIDFFVFNTPLAWYAKFCARSLGVDAARTVSVYPLYANVGPVLLGLNLFHAAHWGKIHRDARVLLYTVGSVSSCCAAVLRWGDVALGPLPEGATEAHLAELEARDESAVPRAVVA